MADLTPEQQATIKRIADQLELSYKAVKGVAANVSGLLAFGRATCDQVKAYNLYALSIYDTQRGMLAAMRAAGQTDAPALPPFPTLFVWKGVAGADAWKIDCKAQGLSGNAGLGLYDAPMMLGGAQLSGVLAAAMQPGSDPQYLSSNEIKIVTSDENVFTPEKSIPSLSELVSFSDQHDGELGIAPVVIALIIAGISLLVIPLVAKAISDYYKERSIQEETTKRSHIQLEAYREYTGALLGCYQDCVNGGGTVATCQTNCGKMVSKPNIITDSARASSGGLGFFGTVGLIAVAGVVGIVGWKVYQRKKHGGRAHIMDDDDVDYLPA